MNVRNKNIKHTTGNTNNVVGDGRGQVVRVVDLESLVPHCRDFESRQGLCILSCEEVIQLAYGTSMILLRWPLVLEIHRGAPEKSPYNVYSVGAT